MTRKSAQTSFVRPANITAYTVGDIVANAAAAGSVVSPALRVSGVPGAGGSVIRVMLAKSSASIVNALFRVHLFVRSPVTTSGDNAPIAIAGLAAGYVGRVDLTIDKNFSDAAYADAAADLPYQLPEGGRDLYAVVEALGAYTPVSGETFTIRLGIERD